MVDTETVSIIFALNMFLWKKVKKPIDIFDLGS